MNQTVALVARFHACVSGTPKPEISWFHEQEPVKPNKNVVFHYDEMTNVATLIIVDAFSEHAGRYTCKATNAAGEAVCTATLAVTREVTAFKCKLVARPAPTILWFHNNRQIQKEHRRKIHTASKMHVYVTSLTINEIKDKDSGSYRVMAINTEGSAESTASLLVSLREEQDVNYVSLSRRSDKSHSSLDSLVDSNKERKFRVDLRCIGSPFDKSNKGQPRGRPRPKSAVFPEKDSKLETASERARSPPPMFERHERFSD
uniref:Ig-like domain-containing protein n=1 Tax=Astyanax mexicanus TaxID=7994 RepID=A0A8B9LQC6_ASTMX